MKEFTVEHLFANERMVICRKGHPLSAARSLRNLTDAQWLVSGATGMASAEHDRVFTGLGLPVPQSVVHCEYATALVSLLACTDMVSIMPRQYAESGAFEGLFVAIPIREVLPGADIVLVQKSGMPLTPAAEYMLTLLRRHIGYYLNPSTTRRRNLARSPSS